MGHRKVAHFAFKSVIPNKKTTRGVERAVYAGRSEDNEGMKATDALPGSRLSSRVSLF
jgi:hypothetical protein